MKAVVAGGSGFVGHYLVEELKTAGYEVVVLSRELGKGKVREVKWDGKSQGEWSKEVDGAAAVFNLSGAPIDRKWTPEYRKTIIDSRVDSTRAIGEAIRNAQSRPKAWINASASGWYGDRGDEILGESARAGEGFLHDVCQEWEQSCLVPDFKDVKQVCLRTGIVLGKEGGIFPVISKLAKLGLGGAAADGKQWVPVIHVKDLARMYVWCIGNGLEGPINGCCPRPVRNSDLMGKMRAAYGRPFSPPVPKFALELGSSLMGKEGGLLLMSQRAVPTLALSQGFRFDFGDADSIIESLV